jgi:hypothetical protein
MADLTAGAPIIRPDKPEPSPCCDPDTLATCCEPDAKETCCGTDDAAAQPGSCGCTR